MREARVQTPGLAAIRSGTNTGLGRIVGDIPQDVVALDLGCVVVVPFVHDDTLRSNNRQLRSFAPRCGWADPHDQSTLCVIAQNRPRNLRL
jgi:hypothetical protein